MRGSPGVGLSIKESPGIFFSLELLAGDKTRQEGQVEGKGFYRPPPAQAQAQAQPAHAQAQPPPPNLPGEDRASVNA